MTTLAEVRARFARDQGLPFADSLTELRILDVLNEHGVQYRDRLFSPVTTDRRWHCRIPSPIFGSSGPNGEGPLMR
jgi:hypothetical protein